MPKIKLTKNELKTQKESLKRFLRYLPMLQLKKQQLQLEVLKTHKEIEKLSDVYDDFRTKVVQWSDVFAENVKIEEFISVKKVNVTEGNVAGIDIPIFKDVTFDEKDYDLMQTPFWVGQGIEAIKEATGLRAQLKILHDQLNILKDELHVVNQRVNLFEKVKIPDTKDNIRVIQVYLGDLQTADVVRGKLAKGKIEKRKEVGAEL